MFTLVYVHFPFPFYQDLSWEIILPCPLQRSLKFFFSSSALFALRMSFLFWAFVINQNGLEQVSECGDKQNIKQLPPHSHSNFARKGSDLQLREKDQRDNSSKRDLRAVVVNFVTENLFWIFCIASDCNLPVKFKQRHWSIYSFLIILLKLPKSCDAS